MTTAAALLAATGGVTGILLRVLIVVLSIPAALTVVHLTVLTVAALTYREPPVTPIEHPLRFLVLVPAHNEEAVIGRTLAAIRADMRDRDRLLVVADRCTDRTADIARAHGAEVLERPPDAEPGRGPARQAGLDHARDWEWDAVAMIDADSVIEPGYFDACERMLARGHAALQARSESAPGTTLAAQAGLASFALQGVTIPRGRARLGLPVRLRGTGMVLRRELIEQFRFRATASEDLWLGLDLWNRGVRAAHVDSARLRSEAASTWRVASAQKLRNEAGRMGAARAFLGQLLRRRDIASLEAAWYLASPPFAIAALLLIAATAVSLALHNAGLAILDAALLGLLAADLVLALALSRAPARTWAAVLAAPWVMLWKLGIQLLALTDVLRRRSGDYPPTPRDAAPDPRAPDRSETR